MATVNGSFGCISIADRFSTVMLFAVSGAAVNGGLKVAAQPVVTMQIIKTANRFISIPPAVPSVQLCGGPRHRPTRQQYCTARAGYPFFAKGMGTQYTDSVPAKLLRDHCIGNAFTDM